jgi:hypothetical protein
MPLLGTFGAGSARSYGLTSDGANLVGTVELLLVAGGGGGGRTGDDGGGVNYNPYEKGY